MMRIIERVDFKSKLNYFCIISVYVDHYPIDGGDELGQPATLKKLAAGAPPASFPVSSALCRELARIEIA